MVNDIGFLAQDVGAATFTWSPVWPRSMPNMMCLFQGVFSYGAKPPLNQIDP